MEETMGKGKSSGGGGGGSRGGSAGNSKAANDNRSNQLNPTSPTYYTGRDMEVPSSLPSGPKPEGK